jgi:hypothetical protein
VSLPAAGVEIPLPRPDTMNGSCRCVGVCQAPEIEPLHVAFVLYEFGSVGPSAFARHEPGRYDAGMKGIIDLSS